MAIDILMTSIAKIASFFVPISKLEPGFVITWYEVSWLEWVTIIAGLASVLRLIFAFLAWRRTSATKKRRASAVHLQKVFHRLQSAADAVEVAMPCLDKVKAAEAVQRFRRETDDLSGHLRRLGAGDIATLTDGTREKARSAEAQIRRMDSPGPMVEVTKSFRSDMHRLVDELGELAANLALENE